MVVVMSIVLVSLVVAIAVESVGAFVVVVLMVALC